MRFYILIAALIFGTAGFTFATMALWNRAQLQALEGVIDANRATIESALEGVRDAGECRARGGVWRPASGRSGQCVIPDF